MPDDTLPAPKTSLRSTQADFVPQEAFKGLEQELLYYKQEYQRLKAIIALQKQKIKRLVGQGAK
jgi:hypothetical protein